MGRGKERERVRGGETERGRKRERLRGSARGRERLGEGEGMREG